MLGSSNILDHVSDTPWANCQVELFGMQFTLMSSGIATMLLIGAVLVVVLPILTRRYVRSGGAISGPDRSISGSIMEVLVLFVRDQIAIPALGKRAYAFLPFLLTLFVFVLSMNLSELSPVEAVMQWATNHHFPVGHRPTSILTVCAALAAIAMIAIVGSGLWRSARRSRLPIWAALPISPILWFVNLAPSIPGVVGKIMCVPLAILELIGVVAKCFALMIRLFANMIAGQIMLAVLMMFIIQTLVATYETATDPMAANNIHFFYVAPICILGSVLVDFLELLVGGLQAYIYTFLTAMFLGLYAEPSH